MINPNKRYSSLSLIIIIWFLLITPITLYRATTDKNVVSADQCSVNSQENRFFVSNITTEVRIFWLFEIPRIGQTWNVTLDLDANSSTKVIWDVRSGSGATNMWEGQNRFILQTGESVTNQYISHVCGDNYYDLNLCFYLTLSNSAANASGHYSAIQIFQGYGIPPECSKGQLIVSDISEWLAASQTKKEDPNMVPFLFFGFFLILIVITRWKSRN